MTTPVDVIKAEIIYELKGCWDNNGYEHHPYPPYLAEQIFKALKKEGLLE